MVPSGPSAATEDTELQSWFEAGSTRQQQFVQGSLEVIE